jgi:prephenate dehydrogenase
MTTRTFNKIVVFGVGLIGGSFAMALRKVEAVGEVVGFGRSEKTLVHAQQLGIIDRIGKDIAAEVADADLVFLATPVGQMAELMKRIAPHLGTHTLITDGGSTKSDVVREAYAQLGKKAAQFVPAHPIAGGEQSGAAAARADLFQWKKVVLTPLPENSAVSVDRVRRAWEQCGAMVSTMTPKQHDEVFAVVSHLPHLLSFALVHGIAQQDNRDLLLSFAAGGFRDFTRIAASSPEMWRDICLANREALSKELQIYIAELNRISAALSAGDGADLEKIFRTAHELRSGWS